MVQNLSWRIFFNEQVKFLKSGIWFQFYSASNKDTFFDSPGSFLGPRLLAKIFHYELQLNHHLLESNETLGTESTSWLQPTLKKIMIIKLILSAPGPLSRNLKKGPGATSDFLTTKFFNGQLNIL